MATHNPMNSLLFLRKNHAGANSAAAAAAAAERDGDAVGDDAVQLEVAEEDPLRIAIRCRENLGSGDSSLPVTKTFILDGFSSLLRVEVMVRKRDWVRLVRGGQGGDEKSQARESGQAFRLEVRFNFDLVSECLRSERICLPLFPRTSRGEGQRGGEAGGGGGWAPGVRWIDHSEASSGMTVLHDGSVKAMR